MIVSPYGSTLISAIQTSIGMRTVSLDKAETSLLVNINYLQHDLLEVHRSPFSSFLQITRKISKYLFSVLCKLNFNQSFSRQLL